MYTVQTSVSDRLFFLKEHFSGTALGLSTENYQWSIVNRPPVDSGTFEHSTFEHDTTAR